MDKPTEAQIKKFWEWCGFIWQKRGKFETDGYILIYPNKSQQQLTHLHYPPIDLNNLFKYAVPKVVKWIMGNNPDGETKAIVYTEKNFFKGLDKDPALALFWAIWEVIAK